MHEYSELPEDLVDTQLTKILNILQSPGHSVAFEMRRSTQAKVQVTTHLTSGSAVAFHSNNTFNNDPHFISTFTFLHNTTGKYIPVFRHHWGESMCMLHAAANSNEVVELEICQVQQSK